MGENRKTLGRYDDVQSAQHPGQELPRAPRNMRGKIEICVGAVPDPNPIYGERLKRQRVAINIACCPLEREYGNGRISPEAYAAGRAYADLMEYARPRSADGSGVEPRSRSTNATEHAIIKKIQNAQDVVRVLSDVRDAIGARPAKLLERILADGMTFSDCAVMMWHSRSAWRVNRVGERFRAAVEALAVHWRGV